MPGFIIMLSRIQTPDAHQGKQKELAVGFLLRAIFFCLFVLLFGIKRQNVQNFGVLLI